MEEVSFEDRLRELAGSDKASDHFRHDALIAFAQYTHAREAERVAIGKLVDMIVSTNDRLEEQING